MLTPKLATRSDFAPESRVWVYVASRPLTTVECAFVQEQLNAFTRQWTAHNQDLQAAGEIFENQFVILMVDETNAGASGCSIDKSVHFLEQLGQHLGVDLFERMLFGWVDGEQIKLENRNSFGALVQQSGILPDTPVINTLVQSKKELSEKWLLPFGQSWHRRLF